MAGPVAGVPLPARKPAARLAGACHGSRLQRLNEVVLVLALLQEQLLEEMSGVKEKMERRLKREKRRRKEQKTKARIRAAQMAQSEWELWPLSVGQVQSPSSYCLLLGCSSLFLRFNNSSRSGPYNRPAAGSLWVEQWL